jgi:hypothetical protein
MIGRDYGHHAPVGFFNDSLRIDDYASDRDRVEKILKRNAFLPKRSFNSNSSFLYSLGHF